MVEEVKLAGNLSDKEALDRFALLASISMNLCAWTRYENKQAKLL